MQRSPKPSSCSAWSSISAWKSSPSSWYWLFWGFFGCYFFWILNTEYEKSNPSSMNPLPWSSISIIYILFFFIVHGYFTRESRLKIYMRRGLNLWWWWRMMVATSENFITLKINSLFPFVRKIKSTVLIQIHQIYYKDKNFLGFQEMGFEKWRTWFHDSIFVWLIWMLKYGLIDNFISIDLKEKKPRRGIIFFDSWFFRFPILFLILFPFHEIIKKRNWIYISNPSVIFLSYIFLFFVLLLFCHIFFFLFLKNHKIWKLKTVISPLDQSFHDARFHLQIPGSRFRKRGKRGWLCNIYLIKFRSREENLPNFQAKSLLGSIFFFCLFFFLIWSIFQQNRWILNIFLTLHHQIHLLIRTRIPVQGIQSESHYQNHFV